MLAVKYGKLIPYRFEVVLGQYYDHEHIAHVHPDSLGEYRLVSVDGDRVVYDQIWPGRRRATSRVEQRLVSANEIWFEFVGGRYRGTRVRSLLEDRGESTFVEETYYLPWLPSWRWLERLVRPSIVRRVDHIWDEDLAVEVCRGGWPGIPEGIQLPDTGSSAAPPAPPDEAEWTDVLDAEILARSGAERISVGGREIALFEEQGELYAIDHRCPHTGGPLAIGRCSRGTVACPWHGAVFSLATGAPLEGPTAERVVAHAVRRVDGRIQVRLAPDATTNALVR